MLGARAGSGPAGAVAARLAAIVCLFAAPLAALAAPPPELAFPGSLAGLARGDRTDYEAKAPGLGYSVRYEGGGWRADLYVYDGGTTGVPDGADAAIVGAQLEQSLGDIRTVVARGGYRSSGHPSPFRLERAGRADWTCATLPIVDREGTPLDSTICLAGLRGAFVKFRLSGRDGPSRLRAERFLGEWTAAQARAGRI